MKKLSIKDAQYMATINNGICLSDIYINSYTHLEWQCLTCKHIWASSLNNVKNGRWCPKCCKTSKPSKISINTLILNRGGYWENSHEDYKNNRQLLQIICHYGHFFKKSWNKLQQGQWCPKCSKVVSISEQICREYFEKIFQKPFPSVRPSWLIGNSGVPLELDGYCAELKLAFEHNGSQHYKKLSFISDKHFNNLINNDYLKQKLLSNLDIKLIIIPELFSKIKLSNLLTFIIKECSKLDIKLPSHVNNLVINTDHLYYSTIKQKNIFMGVMPKNTKYTIIDAKNLAKNKGGECLSDIYNPYGMTWKCDKNHIWMSRISNIISGNWCPHCAKNKKFSIEYINTYIKELSGICLEDNYINIYHPMKWKCDKNHLFILPFLKIKYYNKWCQQCLEEKIK